MNDVPQSAETIDARCRAVVDEVLRPLIAVDGGNITWVRVDGVTAEIQLSGACAGCPGQSLTTEAVILPALRAVDPTIASIRVKIVV